MNRPSSTIRPFTRVTATSSDKVTSQQSIAATIAESVTTTTEAVVLSEVKFNSASTLFDERVIQRTEPPKDATSTSKEQQLSKQSQGALATLSGGKGGTREHIRPIKPTTTQVNSKKSSVVVNKPLPNPFIYQPPNKLFKSNNNTTFSTKTRNPEESLSRNEHGLSQNIASKKPSSTLVLTRVLAANSPRKNQGRESITLNPPASSAKSSSTFNQNNILNSSVNNEKSNNEPASSTTNQHPTTTPQKPPPRDYYDFLMRDNRSEGVSRDEVVGTGKSDSAQEMRKSLTSSAMDFARRSIMQNASASPRSAIRKISKVTEESNGRPSLVDLLTASETADNFDAESSNVHSSGFAHPDTPFTFESTAKLTLDTETSERPPDDFEQNALNALDTTLDKETYTAANDSSGIIASSSEGEMHSRQSLLTPQDTHVSQSNINNIKPTIYEDLARSKSNSAFLPRSSIAHRAAPYKPPTVNEREALRSSRASHFRAKPLNHKVLTSAGDIGVPRVKKLPLTIPISPEFSKPRVKTTTTSAAHPVKTDAYNRLSNLIKSRLDKPPIHPKSVGTSSGIFGKAVNKTNATATVEYGESRNAPIDQATGNVKSTSSPGETKDHKSTFTSGIFSSEPVIRTVQGRLSSESGSRKAIQGPPIRGDKPASVPAIGEKSSSQREELSTESQPRGLFAKHRLTQPVPFKFATDEILRRRRVMFQPKKSPEVTSSASFSAATTRKESNGDKNTKVVRHPQPHRKLITIPVPFHLATQRRAEIYTGLHPNDKKLETQSPSILGARRRSRLDGMLPLRRPPGVAAVNSSTAHFIPTVPISPNLGRRVPVVSLQPSRFLLKKSTKELTQPIEFRFHSEQRAKERDAFDQSAKNREQELAELKERTAKITRERQQRLKLREGLERTFHARPIKHYQPIVIHKATRPLTQPVSPMIGEKRKRYEMEVHQQEQDIERGNHSLQSNGRLGSFSSSQHAGSMPNSRLSNVGTTVNPEIYRQFEQGKILQEEHQVLQEQLTRQELRQLELANSDYATIHQPPIRLSFPMNLEMENSQGRQNDDDDDDGIQKRNVTPPLPPVRDSFEGSKSPHLSRELRRISLEASRGSSGGYRKRVSDIGGRNSIASSSNRTSMGERKSLENSVGVASGYFPFTKSQEPTSSYKTEEPKPSPSKAAEQESEDRRRSGSFIPLDVNESSKPPSIPRTSRLSFGPSSNFRSRAVPIDFTLTLGDLS
ncbi:hypothetical protein BGZ76_001187 [Entomortierella beljakovae]|nr:hypothetical protein BGZ76_001187 [Entomortierella beljakovae]